MMTRARFMWLLFATAAITQAKPLNPSIDESIDESINEIDHDNTNLQKNPFRSNKQRNSVLPTKEASIQETTQTDATNSAVGTINTTIQSFRENSTIKPGPLSWFLTPLVQKIQFSPQSFLHDRLLLLKDALNNLGINVLQNVTAKQLSGPGLLTHFLGPNDSGFYTNRLEPAGFLGGNGWFANKGGILGGPGAIVSTGSFLTDYQTAYRRK